MVFSFNYKKKKKFFFTLNYIFFGSSFLKDTLIMEDFKSILLDLVKYQNTLQLQVQERIEGKW